jgi:signal transduction histidine kinase
MRALAPERLAHALLEALDLIDAARRVAARGTANIVTQPDVILTGPAELSAENVRLRAELRARLDEIRACRGCLGDAIYAERRRLERDLHDGAQGRLVSAALSLGLLEAKLPSDAHIARPLVRDARQAVAAALAELRNLSHGIYPAVLTERGLGPAVAELCEGATLPVDLEVALDRRPAREVEATAYFVVSEALTNTAKHAGAQRARVAAWHHDRFVVVEVSDDGIGDAVVGAGSGLRGLTDRVERLGGRLTVVSPPGQGTTIRARIPDSIIATPYPLRRRPPGGSGTGS